MYPGLYDYNAAFELTQKALTPLKGFSELFAKTFEKYTRFQLDTAIDLVNHGVARIDATMQARSPFQLAARHSELTMEFTGKRTQQWQDLLKFTTELQGDMSKWVDEAKEQVTIPLRSAA